MAEKHLSNYHLIRKRVKWNFGREYVYNNEKENIFITVGLHQSYNEAFNIATQYLKNISNSMIEDFKEDMIGDNFWWWAPYADFDMITNLIFIRINAVFILSSHRYENLKNLAKKIDDDVINQVEYITFSD